MSYKNTLLILMRHPNAKSHIELASTYLGQWFVINIPVQNSSPWRSRCIKSPVAVLHSTIHRTRIQSPGHSYDVRTLVPRWVDPGIGLRMGLDTVILRRLSSRTLAAAQSLLDYSSVQSWTGWENRTGAMNGKAKSNPARPCFIIRQNRIRIGTSELLEWRVHVE